MPHSAAQHSRLAFPYTFQNIEVTLLLPGQLKRPWAQLPGCQHRPHLLSQKYLLPQWPRLVTPFLGGARGSQRARGSRGGGGMSSSQTGKDREAHHSSQAPSQPASRPCAHWPDEGSQSLDAMSLGCGTLGQEKLAAYLVATSLRGCFSGWSLRRQKAQDERGAGLTQRGALGLRPGSDWLLASTQPTHFSGCPQAVPVPFGNATTSNRYQMLTSFLGLC